jgi:hypothetical protein
MSLLEKGTKGLSIGCLSIIGIIFSIYILRFIVQPIAEGNWNYFKPDPPCHPLDDSINEADSTTMARCNQAVMSIMERSKPEDFRYYFLQTIEKEMKYMKVNVRNDTICFDVIMNTGTRYIIDGMLYVNGSTYPKELYGLQWKIEEINGKREIVYKTMHHIID